MERRRGSPEPPLGSSPRTPRATSAQQASPRALSRDPARGRLRAAHATRRPSCSYALTVRARAKTRRPGSRCRTVVEIVVRLRPWRGRRSGHMPPRARTERGSRDRSPTASRELRSIDFRGARRSISAKLSVARRRGASSSPRPSARARRGVGLARAPDSLAAARPGPAREARVAAQLSARAHRKGECTGIREGSRDEHYVAQRADRLEVEHGHADGLSLDPLEVTLPDRLSPRLPSPSANSRRTPRRLTTPPASSPSRLRRAPSAALSGTTCTRPSNPSAIQCPLASSSGLKTPTKRSRIVGAKSSPSAGRSAAESSKVTLRTRRASPRVRRKAQSSEEEQTAVLERPQQQGSDLRTRPAALHLPALRACLRTRCTALSRRRARAPVAGRARCAGRARGWPVPDSTHRASRPRGPCLGARDGRGRQRELSRSERCDGERNREASERAIGTQD